MSKKTQSYCHVVKKDHCFRILICDMVIHFNYGACKRWYHGIREQLKHSLSTKSAAANKINIKRSGVKYCDD